tara:strand:+ start:29 stop:1153 length:1125 start_codon:yes stop_codon:yes gene_type:complete
MTKASPDSPRLMIFENELLESTVGPYFSGWKKKNSDEILKNHTPLFSWDKNKIPFVLWEEIVSFMRWGFKTYSSEVLVALFYNTAEDKWAAWAFPQTTQGMTVQFNEDDPDYKIDRRQFSEGWVQLGSVHHHCSMAAFASGTDTADEEDREGVHITLGNMNQEVLDIHIRQTFTEIVGDVNPENFIEMPEWSKDLPIKVKKHITKNVFVDIELGKFPKLWETRVTKEIHRPAQYPFSSSNPSRWNPKNQMGFNHVKPHEMNQDIFDENYDEYWEPIKSKKVEKPNLQKKLESKKAKNCGNWHQYLTEKLDSTEFSLMEFRLVYEDILTEENLEDFTMSISKFKKLKILVKEIIEYAECPETEIHDFLTDMETLA